MPLPLMGEDTGEGEQGAFFTGPLSLSLSHEGLIITHIYVTYEEAPFEKHEKLRKLS